jgi:hypothetical protein
MNNTQRIATEKRIVRGLIRAMSKAGWTVSNVFNGEEHVFPKTQEQAVDAVFEVDEASLRFVKADQLAGHDKDRKVPKRPFRQESEDEWSRGGDWWDGTEHGVLLVLGNGFDIISDWNYTDGDPDGFNAVMDVYAKKVWEGS